MSETTNKLGHRIGRRGGRTRQAILEAVRALLQTRHFGEIRVADVAAAAGVSASNYYTYFKTVEEPILALSEEAASDCGALASHLQTDWAGDRAFEAARELVRGMLEVWRVHGPALRVEHLMADRGDIAFAESRVRRLRRLHLALERRIAQAQANGLQSPGLSPRLASYEVASLLESVAAGFTLLMRADTPEAIVDTTAHVVVKLTTGR